MLYVLFVAGWQFGCACGLLFGWRWLGCVWLLIAVVWRVAILRVWFASGLMFGVLCLGFGLRLFGVMLYVFRFVSGWVGLLGLRCCVEFSF